MSRICVFVVGGLFLACTSGCRLLGSGPRDADVNAAVRRSPPSPPTAGPTYLAEIASVQVQERRRYNGDGQYWPVRVRVKGAAKIRLTNVFQPGLPADVQKEPATSVDFVEEAHFTKDDFGNWRVFYAYEPAGPRWRLDGRDTSRGDR
jgi:hypothetical protein